MLRVSSTSSWREAESSRSLIILLAVLPVSVLTNSPKYLGRIAAFVGKVGYGRQPFTLRFPGNVFIEQRDELLDHRMIDLLACDKLAVVEAQTVVQQQLDVRNDEFTRMPIYRMLAVPA